MAKQFTDESRKMLYKNLNTRIDNAEIEIKKLTHYPEKLEEGQDVPKGYTEELAGKQIPATLLSQKASKDIDYLQTRIKTFQLSLRLAFNIEWVIEQRKEMIKVTAEIMRTEYGPIATEMTEEMVARKQYHITRLNDLTRAVKCNRKGCYTGRGFVGWTTTTGEAILCKCTLDTINHYKLND
jgi:hypothetical protein